MRETLKLTVLIMILFAVPSFVEASNCGKIKGQKIVTYGGLTCSEAKSIYKAFQRGHIPDGWSCGLSAGDCNKGDKGFTFRFN